MSRSRHGRRKSSGSMRIPRLCGRTHEGPIYRRPNVGCPVSEANREGHRHKTTQEKVKLREVVEVAKTFEATTFANHIIKKQPETHSRSRLTTQPNCPSCHSVFGLVGNINSPVSNIALPWERICKIRYQWPLRAPLQGWNTTTSSTAAIQFCL